MTQEELISSPLLKISNLKKYFPISVSLFKEVQETVYAVNGFSLDIGRGEVVGLVGESGSGKTTAGRTILRLVEPTAGQVFFEGVDICKLPARQMRDYRRKMQIIFQDPFGSLDPRFTAEAIIGEAIDTHRLARGPKRRDRIVSLLEMTGLGAEYLNRYPHEFSGGQRQRIGIARALAVEPQFIVADEPVSALDVSIQAQVLNLLQELKRTLQLTLLMIAHDLAVVEISCDRVVVMYLGHIMEVAQTRDLFSNPHHPYTEALLDAVPISDPTQRRQRRTTLKGEIPSPIRPPSGCVFRTRCPLATSECAKSRPPLEEVAPGHLKACFHR